VWEHASKVIPVPRLARASLGAVLGASVLAAPAVPARSTVPAAVSAAVGAVDLSSFMGLGSWVDIYDHRSFADPEGTVAAMAAAGVRTLYLQTSNFRAPGALMYRERLGRFLDAAHARGMATVAWYVPALTDVTVDLNRVLAAVGFRSPTGVAFAAFGLDIEAREVADPAARNRRLLALSGRMRRRVGPDYPLAAIVFPPAQMEMFPDFWTGFPYRGLAETYDVFMPMGYWTFRVEGRGAAYHYTRRTIEILRTETGRPDVPIHAIGGIADDAEPAEVTGFVRAVREHGLIGASLYDFATSDARDWGLMAQIAPNPVQAHTLPLAIDEDVRGFGDFAGDDTHPREVIFRLGRRPGTWELDFQGLGDGLGEVTVYVNWEPVARLEPAESGWSGRRTVALPPEALDRGSNLVAFVVEATGPPWPEWGVRRVTLVPPTLPRPDRSPHGNVPGGETSRFDRVSYRLPEGAGPLALTVSAFGTAPGEVAIDVNGRRVGTLARSGGRRWSGPQLVVLPRGALHGDGTDALTFDAAGRPGTRPVWGVRLLSLRGLTPFAVL